MKITSSPVDPLRTPASDSQGSAFDRSIVVEERFRGSGYLALRDVRCIARDDVLYLHGGLPSYFLKQIAQEIAVGVGGVRQVVNRIDVRRTAGPRVSRAGGP